MHARVTDFFIYRWRYPLGYLLIAALLALVVGIAIFTAPGGLRAGEMDSTVMSASLSVESLDPNMVINLPYHVLQRVVFIFLGVTTFTVKLPSVILGTLTIVGVFFLMRVWFRRNVAVLTAILAATSTQFLFLLQDGTPAIMYSFVVVWLLLSGSLVTRNYMFNTFWKVVAGVLLATALYMPLGVYLVIATVVTAAFHPHIRYIVRHISRLRLILALSLAAAFITPLVYASIIDTEILRTLLGVNIDHFSLTGNAIEFARTFAGFFSIPKGYILTPLHSVGLVVLMTIGVYRLCRERHTARGYMTFILGGILLPFVYLDTSQAGTVFALAVLLMGYGMTHLIRSWYRLFPRNPYARIAGLIPLSVVVIGMVYSGIIRYVHQYTYNPQVLSHFSDDLRLLNGTLDKLDNGQTAVLVTTSEELPFYNVVAHYNHRLSATTNPATYPITIVTHDAHHLHVPDGELTTIVASTRANDSDRFYIYKNTQE